MKGCGLPLAFVLAFCLFGAEGCTMYAGLAVHSEHIDSPEVTLQNPIFVGGGEMDCKVVTCYIEHDSGVFVREDGYGYTRAGFKYYWDGQ